MLIYCLLYIFANFLCEAFSIAHLGLEFAPQMTHAYTHSFLDIIQSKMGWLHSSEAGCVFVTALHGHSIPLCVFSTLTQSK